MATDTDECSDSKEVASVNVDRTVNSLDLGLVASHFGPPNSPQYIYGLDVTKDSAINSLDLGFIAKYFFGC